MTETRAMQILREHGWSHISWSTRRLAEAHAERLKAKGYTRVEIERDTIQQNRGSFSFWEVWFHR